MFDKRIIYCLLASMLLGLASCNTSRRQTENDIYYKKSKSDKNIVRQEINLKKTENKKLYSFVKEWLGVPYRYAGFDKKGVDCSGLTCLLYQEVYGIKLQRNSARIFEINCEEIGKGELEEGDLVFFTTGSSKSGINHVGVFLKDGTFVHAGSKGVTLDDLGSPYYEKHYVASGKVKK